MSGSGTAMSGLSRTSPSPSGPASSTPCSGPRAAARRRCSGCWPGSLFPTPAGSSWTMSSSIRCRRASATSGWSSSTTPSGRTCPSSRTSRSGSRPAAIHVTHDHAEALALSTRIAVLSEGRVIQEGRPEEIYWRPRNRFVAEFVGDANLVPVRVVELREVGVVVEAAGGARLPVASGGHEWTVGARGLLCLRPEALVVEESALARQGLPGTVVAQVFEGSRQLYEIDIVGATLRVEVITSALHGRSFKPGDQVKVEVSPETSVLLPDEGPDAR